MQTTANKKPDLIWLDRISNLMDSQFTLPGTKFRFGLDPLIGLIPFAGDLTGLAVSGVMVMYMARHGASRKLVILMLLNVVLDAVIGSIPVLGSVFDFYYKANDRNVRLLRRYYQEGKYQGSGNGVLLLVGVALLLIAAGLVYGLLKLGEYIAGYF